MTATTGETYACLAAPGMVVLAGGERFEVTEVEVIDEVALYGGGPGIAITFAGGLRGLFAPYAIIVFERGLTAPAT